MSEIKQSTAADTNGTDVEIRWMIRRDLPALIEIERECFSDPWTEQDFCNCLRSRYCIGHVAEVMNDAGHHTIVGFMMYELHKTRVHLLNLAVAKSRWRTGVGRKMVDKFKTKLFGGRTRLVAEIRESNLDGLAFFKAMGFRATSILRGFYDDSDDDAIVMQFRKQAAAT